VRWLTRLWRHEHVWRTIYTDDDECYCGMVRLWPSGEIVTPGELLRRYDEWRG
jgi:hypothetical protein